MTWTIQINGHDSLEAGVKTAYEEEIISKAQAFVRTLVDFGNGEGVVSSAIATTNTTGSVNLLA